MKMNNDLLRSLLICIAGTPQEAAAHREALAAYEARAVAYHALLLSDDFVTTIEFKVANLNKTPNEISNIHVTLEDLTENGRQTLATIRDDALWNKAKEDAAKSGLTEVPFSIMVDVARAYMHRTQTT